MEKLKKIFLTLILLLIPIAAKADLTFINLGPADPSKSENIVIFLTYLVWNFVIGWAILLIILNTFIAWLFVLVVKRIMSSPIKLKKRIYLFFAFIGYFIDQIAFFITYHMLGKYIRDPNAPPKFNWSYKFYNGFGENWVIATSGLLIFLGVSLLTYLLFAKKLYVNKKQRYLFSIIAGIILNPWWWKILF